MKNSTLLIYLLLLGNVYMIAQESFVIKAKGDYLINRPTDCINKPNGNILFLFSSIPDADSVYINEIHELTPFGETIKTYTFTDSLNDFVEYKQCLIADDTLFVFGKGYRITGINSRLPFLLMHKFDLQLNTISLHKFWLEELFPGSLLHGKVQFNNNKFFYIGSFNRGSGIRPFYAKISKQGELLNFGIEGETGKVLMPYDFTVRDDGGFQTYALSSGYIGPYQVCGFVCNYNQNFQIEYYYELPHLLSFFFTHEKANDSLFYLSGQWIDQNASPGWKTGILKMKNDSTVVDEFLYTTYPDTTTCPAYYQSIEILQDGNLIFCFIDNIINNFYPQSEPAKINLMKLTPDFEVVWHRYIGEPVTKYDAYVMHTNEADEIIILGACSQAQPGFNFDMEVLLIKTTPDGLITGTDDDMPGIRSTETLLYPNPAKEFVMVEFSRAYNEATLVISNLNGQEVFKTSLNANKQQVDISKVPAGNYVYSIFNKKGLEESGKLVVGS